MDIHNQPLEQDTIAAIATPPGRGGIGIVRLSGSQTGQVAQAILGIVPPARKVYYSNFTAAGEVVDQGIALYFPTPHSFTGEDVLELQGHGGPVILDMLLQHILTLGVRLARPGEFSERAFLNGKIDLAQAEAIADLIDSRSAQAAKAALNSLQGEFSKRIQKLVKKLIQLRMYIEAAIDFAEEEIDFLAEAKIEQQLDQILAAIQQTRQAAQQGQLLREGMRLVILGKPNAGKSSLLNCLSGQETAIVSAVPGTTRDVLRENIQIEGVPIHVVDTAGLHVSEDVVEQEGIKRAGQEAQRADHILFVVDGNETAELDITQLKREHALLNQALPITFIQNKIDLSESPAKQTQQHNHPLIYLSAKTGDGIALLQQHLIRTLGYQTEQEGAFLARRRHLDALMRAERAVTQGKQQWSASKAGELIAEDLRQAQQALNEITGEFTSDDLLGEIFANFCIGK